MNRAIINLGFLNEGLLNANETNHINVTITGKIRSICEYVNIY